MEFSTFGYFELLLLPPQFVPSLPAQQEMALLLGPHGAMDVFLTLNILHWNCL